MKSTKSRFWLPTAQHRKGQHFLSDPRYCSRIADALDPGPDDLVIEIGPGHGAVTRWLASRARSLVAIELDPPLVEELRQTFQQSPHVEIIHGDILLTDLGEICRRRGVARCLVFGNLPYYITSPIIHHVLGFAPQIRTMGFLVQREVADRLTAQPGSRDYGYLTVFTRFHSSPRVVLQIPPGAFAPPPKVHSAFLRFEMHPGKWDGALRDQQEFLRFLKQSFAFKRKKLLNCLASMYSRQQVAAELEALKFPLEIRAEQLSLGQFIALFSKLHGGAE